MNKFLLLFLIGTMSIYSQTASKTQIIYEFKDQVILNDGTTYKVKSEHPFYTISDQSITAYKEIGENVLHLSRVLILDNNKEYTKLVEWIKPGMKYYEKRSVNENDIKGSEYISSYDN